MRITPLRSSKEDGITYLLQDDIRDSFILELDNVAITGRNTHYPNCLLKVSDKLISPYDERVMSLNRDSFYDNDMWEPLSIANYSDLCEEPVFFFIYNVDNYYHFIYDTLSILSSYFILKKTNLSLKLLINTSHPEKKYLLPFVIEFLSFLGINDYLMVSDTTLYKKVYVSTSFTHGQKSNEPYSTIAKTVWNKYNIPNKVSTPKRFYISRRSWIHGKTENIGTNYTTRRKCMNEDQVVDLLKQYDIQEVFTELLTTEEKIAYFQNAELVVGVVGGGMCNLLFASSFTKSLCINTPHFLTINKRFQFSMNHTNIVYSDCTQPFEKNVKFQLYTRVRVINKESNSYGFVGEVEKRSGTLYSILLSSNDIAGFSQDFPLIMKTFDETELKKLDDGLNSPYLCDIVQLEYDLKLLLKKC